MYFPEIIRHNRAGRHLHILFIYKNNNEDFLCSNAETQFRKVVLLKLKVAHARWRFQLIKLNHPRMLGLNHH